MSVILCIMIIPMSIIGSLLYEKAVSTVIQKQHAYAMNAIKNMMLSIENTTNYARELSLMMIQNKEIRTFLKTDISDLEMYRKHSLDLYYDLLFYAGKKEYIDAIYVLGENGAEFESEFGRKHYIPDEILKEVETQKGGIVWGSSKEELYIVRSIMDINNPGTRLGLLKINLSSKAIQRLFDNFLTSYSENISLIDANGNIILSSGEHKDVDYQLIAKRSDARSGVYEEGDQISYYIHEPKSNWTIVMTIALSDLLQEVNSIKNLLTMAVVISVFICIVLTMVFTKTVLVPIKQLTEKIREIQLGNYKVRLDFKSNDEIGSISKGFNEMTERLNDLINQVILNKVKQKDLEIKALQAQIDPHSLYNNLDTAYWMSRLEKADKTSKIIGALSVLYKINLNTDGEMSLVKKELEYIQSYFVIQQIRTNNQVGIQFDIDENIMKLKTMSFILQPLVENAIQHGILPYSSEGMIYVRAFVEERALYFVVEDSGQEADVEALYNLLEQEKINGRRGLAIRNIHKRIQLKFGEEYGLGFGKNVEGGLRVVVRQPAL